MNDRVVIFGTPVSIGWLALTVASGFLMWTVIGGVVSAALTFGLTRHWQSGLATGLFVAGSISAYGIRQMLTAGL